jgi:hypothetical protein
MAHSDRKSEKLVTRYFFHVPAFAMSYELKQEDRS